MNDSLFIILMTASIAIVWRQFLVNAPAQKERLEKILHPLLYKTLTCGLCLTYWISLVAILVYNPFQANVFISWMSMGLLANIVRLLVVALQETIHYLFHLNKTHHS